MERVIDERRFIQDIESYKEMGIKACKFKVGGWSPEVDIKGFKLLEEQLLMILLLQLMLIRAEALKFAIGVRDYEIRWFE